MPIRHKGLCSLFLLASVFAPTLSAQECKTTNGLWKNYQQTFIQNDGRVIDRNDTDKSTSEGQGYALFHALIANDPTTFAAVLRWLDDNLSGGELSNRLPGWKWGKNPSGEWTLLEANSASDADLWIAYALLEASRLWNKPDYKTLGLSLLQRIEKEEIESAKGLGEILLPGKYGFKLSQCQWRLNPSYLPIQLFRGLEYHDPGGPWDELAKSSATIIKGSSPKGVSPDWIIYDPSQGFIPDREAGDKSSYDAIRVYLWLGMLSDEDPLKAPLLKHLSFTCQGQCWPPEETHSLSGIRYGEGPNGFKAAVMPWLETTGQTQCLQQMETSLQASPVADEPNYYDENLKLFALGWYNKAYSFDKDGLIQPAWKTSCP